MPKSHADNTCALVMPHILSGCGHKLSVVCPLYQRAVVHTHHTELTLIQHTAVTYSDWSGFCQSADPRKLVMCGGKSSLLLGSLVYK
jgi:hypothetical protein